MKEEAKEWIGKKVRSEIIGLCCNISNNCGHKYPVVKRTNRDNNSIDKRCNDEIDRDFENMRFLLSNFGEYIDIDNIVEDHFSVKANQNQWSTERHQTTFKLYINDGIQMTRDGKLIEIGI